jgi:hypothetical protein
MTGSRSTGLWLIAIFKLVKGLLLLAVGIGALTLLHKALAAAEALGGIPDNHRHRVFLAPRNL